MDHELQRQMAAFEAALIEQPVVLEPVQPKRVLVARDGSNQDDTAMALARAIVARTGGELGEWHGPPSDLAHESILAACEAADLLVVPCPFGADYSKVGADSLSTTLDVILARGRTPVLCVRGAVEDVDELLDHPLVALDVARARKVEATAFALGLCRSGGEVALLDVIDPAEPVKREEIVGRWLDPSDLDDEDLAAMHSARTAALTAALQKRSSSAGIGARVMIQAGSALDVTLEVGEHRGGLIVAGLMRDHRDPGFARARELVLASALPVLLV